MPSLCANKNVNMNGAGCLFQHLGAIPETAYSMDTFSSPLEKAVFDNDVTSCRQLVQEGHKVSVRLKIGEMTCMEYAAMKGYTDILQLLVEESDNAPILRKYFSLNDVVEMAYMISRNKDIFFGRDGLTEANRYEAALFTAVAYDRPDCVRLMLNYLGPQVIVRKHGFLVNDNEKQVMMTALDLAKTKGHTECYEELLNFMNRRTGGQTGGQAGLVNQPIQAVS